MLEFILLQKLDGVCLARKNHEIRRLTCNEMPGKAINLLFVSFICETAAVFPFGSLNILGTIYILEHAHLSRLLAVVLFSPRELNRHNNQSIYYASLGKLKSKEERQLLPATLKGGYFQDK